MFLSDGFIDGWFSFEEVEIMRYTGFQDCYGNDIYEGDIIEYGNSKHDRGAVVMDGGMWYIQGFDRLVSLGYPKIIAYINGNIYNNPELLFK
ncbi:MAG: YopX family protein [Bacillaceae bacterium]